MEITNKHIKFFKETFGIDVSKVKILFTSKDDRYGEYANELPGFIYLNRGKLMEINKGYTSTTIIHELTHLVQYEYNQSLSLEFTKELTASIVDDKSSEMNLLWKDRPLEIDAMITEAYYLYKVNSDLDYIDEIIYKYLQSKISDSRYMEMIIKRLINKNIVDSNFIDIVIRSVSSVEKEIAISKA